MTHAGHSYAGRSIEDMVRIAETERAGVVRAAERLREAGHASDRSSRWAAHRPRCTLSISTA